MPKDDLNVYLGPNRDPEEAIENVTGLLKYYFGYTKPQLLGAGSFGSVVRFCRPKNEGQVAVKFLDSDEISEGEQKIWIRLRHENIVPLLRCTIFQPLGMSCYEMDVYEFDLFSAVQSEEYLENPEALQHLKKWLHQVLNGLNFLHNRELCHLDLKSDNVLISHKETRAMIGDFSFLSRTTSHIKKDSTGLPDMYQPPETTLARKKLEPIDGRYFDLWTFGIMAMELLTSFHVLRSFHCRHSGIKACQASIRGALQPEAFTDKMQSALPAVQLVYDDIEMALNFLHCFLRSNPTNRVSAESAMTHKFLGQGDFVSSEVDAVWQIPNRISMHVDGPAVECPTVPPHEVVKPSRKRRVRKWIRRKCSSIRKLLRSCMPCYK